VHIKKIGLLSECKSTPPPNKKEEREKKSFCAPYYTIKTLAEII